MPFDILIINKIPLKTPFEPSNYFTTLPVLSKELKYDTVNLFSQMLISNNEINSFANITEAIEVITQDLVHFILDIDVFKTGDYKEGEIWKHFENLRNFKNEIFFNSITPITLKLLK